MNRLLVVLLSLIIINISNAQNKEYFDMEPIHTLRKLRETKQNPKVYHVESKQFILTEKGEKKKILNEEYKVLETEILNLMADSAEAEMVYQSKVKDFAETSKIKTLIEDFLSSDEPFVLKKKSLIEAQKLADVHNVHELIYADSEINSSQEGKFLVLQLNDLDLKVHLKEVTWSLDEMNLTMPERGITSLLNQKLVNFRKKKSGTKKYDYITSPTKKISKKELAIKQNSNEPLKNIHGKYTREGLYYVVINDYKLMFKKGMVIDSKTVREYMLEDSGHVGLVQVLIREESTKKQFLTQKDFLNNYAFSINGKFNEKAKRSIIAN